MIVTQTIHMDLAKNGTMPQIYAVQGDTCSRCVAIRLAVDGKPWKPPQDITVSIRYAKPDGTGGHYSSLPDGTGAWSIKGSTVSILLAPQMLTTPGRVITQVELVSKHHLLATFAMEVLVEKDPAVGLIQSKDYVNWLQRVEDRLGIVLMDAKESGLFDGKNGRDGATGATGATPNLQIGAVTTLPYGSEATVTITGTPEEPVLNLNLPRGYDIAEESAEHPGCYYRIVDEEIEWLNPPVMLGVEYRTAERWNGSAVYTKVVNLGAAANGKQVEHGITTTGILRFAGKLSNIPLPHYVSDNYHARIFVSSTVVSLLETGYDGFNVMAQLWYVK